MGEVSRRGALARSHVRGAFRTKNGPDLKCKFDYEASATSPSRSPSSSSAPKYAVCPRVHVRVHFPARRVSLAREPRAVVYHEPTCTN